jgi:Matrixin
VTRRRGLVGLAAAVLTLSVLAGCGPVTHTWQSSSIHFMYGPSLPGGGYRDRAREASANWAGVGLPPRTFSSNAGPWTGDPCVNRTRGLSNGIHLRRIDGAGHTLAATHACIRTDRAIVVNVDIVIDASEAWWVSNSTAISPNTMDLESVVTHEMGHAWGWFGGHLSGGPCQPGPRRHTMCADLPRGVTGQRSPEVGDRNPVALAYGGPLA